VISACGPRASFLCELPHNYRKDKQESPGTRRDALVQSYNLISRCPTSRNSFKLRSSRARFLATILLTLSRFLGPRSPRASTLWMY
jgi:hypothetical protein